MKLDRVVLSKYEGEWFARNVLKTFALLQAHAKKNPDVEKRSTFKVLKALQAQAQELEKSLYASEEALNSYDIKANRKQRQVMRELILKTLTHLELHSLPEYERRNDEEHIKTTKSKMELLNDMQRKFK